ncbi:MAG: hypothetical protein WKF83_08815 [Nocardioidaceae bacterium]
MRHADGLRAGPSAAAMALEVQAGGERRGGGGSGVGGLMCTQQSQPYAFAACGRRAG